jgi:hypothetical protein
MSKNSISGVSWWKWFSVQNLFYGRVPARCKKRGVVSEPEFVNVVKEPGNDSKESIPTAYVAWRNRLLGIDSCAPETFTYSDSGASVQCGTRIQESPENGSDRITHFG